MTDYYIGLMSGSSVDGVDAVLVDFSAPQPQLIASHQHPIPADLRQQLLELTQPQTNELHQVAELDNRLGHLFADAVVTLLNRAAFPAHRVRAIGSHGQTIRHHPYPPYPYTLQIGDPTVIAARTGITTVADFRRGDMAQGGQGAPFAPVFHAHVLHNAQENRAIVNIGGIANVTLLAKGSTQALQGFDTGPGNGLLDSWTQLHLQQPYDADGAWAAQGKVQNVLLAKLLDHPFFKLLPPKSTGRDQFNLLWLNGIPGIHEYQLHDVQSTLAELTAITIADAIKNLPIPVDRIILCGGGVHNIHLVKRLALLCPTPVNASDEFGIPADWLEGLLFAWLAQQALQRRPVDLTHITGAAKPTILGGIYFAS